MSKKTTPKTKAAPPKDTSGLPAAKAPDDGNAEALADLTHPPAAKRVFEAIVNHGGDGVDPKDLEALADVAGLGLKIREAAEKQSGGLLALVLSGVLWEIDQVCAAIERGPGTQTAAGYAILHRTGEVLAHLLAVQNPEYRAALDGMHLDAAAVHRAAVRLESDPMDQTAAGVIHDAVTLWEQCAWVQGAEAAAMAPAAQKPHGIGDAVHQKLLAALQTIPRGEWFSVSKLGTPADRTVVFNWTKGMCDAGFLESNRAQSKGRRYRRK